MRRKIKFFWRIFLSVYAKNAPNPRAVFFNTAHRKNNIGYYLKKVRYYLKKV